MNEELKPCPFCGSIEVNNTNYDKGYLTEDDDNDGLEFVIVCPDCICSILPSSNISIAIERWNKRYDEKSLTPNSESTK